MRALPVVATVLLVAGTGLSQEPGPHFQGAGKAYVWEGWVYCEPGDMSPLVEMALVIEETEAETLARIVLTCPGYVLLSVFPITAPFVALGSTYRLDGSWETGFTGRSLLGDPIRIGPYGDGTDIVVEGTAGDMLSCCGTFYWGHVDDLRVV